MLDVDFSQYSTVVFIDSNIALECAELGSLPWREIQNDGAILILVTPTVLRECDSKKSHPRLGDHARRFNRCLAPLVSGDSAICLRSGPDLKVMLSLASTTPINWAEFSSLDRDEPDARIVAEILHTHLPNSTRRLLISQDIRPLYIAQQFGVETRRIGENWLRPKEISEAEKRAKQLKRDIESMQSRQPLLEVNLATDSPTFPLVRVPHLTPAVRAQICDRIVELNPMPDDGSDDSSFSYINYDSTLRERYRKWETKLVPDFIADIEKKVELLFGQIEVRFTVKNIGNVPAESLLIRLTSSSGWLNEKFVIVNPMGPSKPKRKSGFHDLHRAFQPSPVTRIPHKHEFETTIVAECSPEFQIACADFRQGTSYDFSCVAWMDPYLDDFKLTATLTAANLYGDITKVIEFPVQAVNKPFSEIVDLESMHLIDRGSLAVRLEEAIKSKDLSRFEVAK
jgi:hypothetical protein